MSRSGRGRGSAARRIVASRRAGSAVLALAGVLGWAVTASAQLDPLTLIRRVPPTVIIVVDTSLEMLQDGNNKFYDPGFWPTSDATVMPAFPSVPLTAKTYRRVFTNLQYASPGKYTATSVAGVTAVWDPSKPLTSNNPADLAFLDPTRLGIAKAGIVAAMPDEGSVRWGLVRLRQKSPAWRSTPGGSTWGTNDCDKPVAVSGSAFGDLNASGCNAGGVGKFGVYAPKAGSGGSSDAGYNQSSAPAGTVMIAAAAGTSTAVQTLASRNAGDSAGLIPASVGGVQFADRPLSYALDDAKQAVIDAANADAAATRSCRNSVVILITGGKDSGDSSYLSANNVLTKATSFTNVTIGGAARRVPIHVIGVKAPSADDTQLQTIAANSGGSYHNVGTAVDVAAAIHYAVEAGYGRAADQDAGRPSEFAAVTPVVGTVNLTGGKDSTGANLPNDVIHVGGVSTAAVIPQRSNVLITAAFELPGFFARLRAFRVYKPVADSTKPTGYRFQNDGTKLWPDLDSRPSLAGQARTPLDTTTRNIYTYVPDGVGGGTLTAFTAANAATLATHMNLTTANATTVINFVRSQPLGAIIGSTPAIMDPPSLDPPPDDDYGRPSVTGTFAGNHANRRTIIFVGGNDGMLHAIDARTGYEVWAFIPYNLLPKLTTLTDGQTVERFDYFVDSSAKLAEVKISGVWKSLLLIGEGWGGTFYQCFDVSEAGMGVDPTLGDATAVSSLLTQFDAPGKSITFKWSLPNYSSFDPTIKSTFTLTDGTPGGKITMWGDLKSTATYVEKTVGFTWSDPAVGPLIGDRSVNGVVVGSGYFPPIESLLTNRSGAGDPKAGNALYLLNADTGTPVGNTSGSTCGSTNTATDTGTGTGCIQVTDVAANNRKNAIQADATAAGDAGLPTIKKAYVGDTDGKYWRFDFTSAGALTANLMGDTGLPIYASSALLFVGTTDVYMFFATGSDTLPPTTSGGTGTYNLYALKDNSPAAGATTKFSIPLATVSVTGGLVTGERPSTSPTVAGDIVFYTTTTEAASTPCSDFSSNLYGVTYSGTAAYDANNNGIMDVNESKIIKTLAGRASAPFIVDQHLYFATAGTAGTAIQAFGDPQDFNNGVGQVGVRILSWREIR